VGIHRHLAAVRAGVRAGGVGDLVAVGRSTTTVGQSGEPFVEGWQLFDGDEGGGFHILAAPQSTSRIEGFPPT